MCRAEDGRERRGGVDGCQRRRGGCAGVWRGHCGLQAALSRAAAPVKPRRASGVTMTFASANLRQLSPSRQRVSVGIPVDQGCSQSVYGHSTCSKSRSRVPDACAQTLASFERKQEGAPAVALIGQEIVRRLRSTRRARRDFLCRSCLSARAGNCPSLACSPCLPLLPRCPAFAADQCSARDGLLLKRECPASTWRDALTAAALPRTCTLILLTVLTSSPHRPCARSGP